MAANRQKYMVQVKRLTQMSSWTMAKFPREDATCSGHRSSLGLTGALTSSLVQWVSTCATDFTSDLERTKIITIFEMMQFDIKLRH